MVMIVNQNGSIYGCKIEGNRVIFELAGMPILQGDYLGQDSAGDYMVDIKGKRYYLVYCPITHEHWMMDDKKTPCITPKPYIYQPLQCKRDNYICHTISKNGCASVLKSILWADGRISAKEKDSNAFIWARCRDYPYFDGTIEAYSGKKFIILQSEKDRIIRWANWLNTNRYAGQYNFNLPDDKLIDLILWSYQHVALNDDQRMDQHAQPQALFVRKIIDKYYHGSVQEFKDSVDIVQLADLGEYYNDTLHAELIRNNITPDNKKRFIWERLTHEQQEKIETIAAQYPLDFLQ